jgi:hypothetical protein
MHDAPDACGLGRFGNHFRAFGLHRGKTLLAAFGQQADQIDHRIGTGHRMGHRIGKAQIGLHGMDLPCRTQRLEKMRQIGTAHRHTDPVTPPGQSPDHMPSDKTGPAKHCHQLTGCVVHDRSPRLFTPRVIINTRAPV